MKPEQTDVKGIFLNNIYIQYNENVKNLKLTQVHKLTCSRWRYGEEQTGWRKKKKKKLTTLKSAEIDFLFVIA